MSETENASRGILVQYGWNSVFFEAEAVLNTMWVRAWLHCKRAGPLSTKEGGAGVGVAGLVIGGVVTGVGLGTDGDGELFAAGVVTGDAPEVETEDGAV